MAQQDGAENAAGMDNHHTAWLGSGYEVRSASGQTFTVKAAPSGVPLRYNEGAVGVIEFLVWQTYMRVRAGFPRRWKVAVLRQVGGRYWKRERMIYKQTLPRGVPPETSLQALEESCREGAFDRLQDPST